MKQTWRAILLFALALSWCIQPLDCLQVVAWTKMYLSSAEKGDVASNLERILDPKKPCPMCCKIRSLRVKAEEHNPTTPHSPQQNQRLVFWILYWEKASVTSSLCFASAKQAPWELSKAETSAGLWKCPPPIPPPRFIRFQG